MSVSRLVLGVDLGGSEIKVGIVAGDTVAAHTTIPARSKHGLAAALPRIETAAQTCLDRLGADPRSLVGCGVAYAGLVHCDDRRIVGSNGKYEDGAEVDLVAWAAERWGTRLVLDNDARLAAVGEWKFGSGRGSDDVVVLTLGTGIGSGVIMRGRILRGKHFRAGNLGGHIPLAVDGEVECSCGGRNCAEALASTWALRRDLAAVEIGEPGGDLLRRKDVGFRELFAAVDAGNAAAKRLEDHTVATWATLAVAMIHAYDPDRVVVTGNVMHAAARILPVMQRYIERYAWLPDHRVELFRGAFPGTAALLGAAYVTTIEENNETV